MRNYFVLNGKNSKDYGVYISGGGTFNAPRRSREKVTIPGRNGALTIDNGCYENIPIEYPAFIYDNFNANISAFRNMLLTNKKYVRLEDSYHPDEYRLALYDGDFQADVIDNLRAGGLNRGKFPGKEIKKMQFLGTVSFGCFHKSLLCLIFCFFQSYTLLFT